MRRTADSGRRGRTPTVGRTHGGLTVRCRPSGEVESASHHEGRNQRSQLAFWSKEIPVGTAILVSRLLPRMHSHCEAKLPVTLVGARATPRTIVSLKASSPSLALATLKKKGPSVCLVRPEPPLSKLHCAQVGKPQVSPESPVMFLIVKESDTWLKCAVLNQNLNQIQETLLPPLKPRRRGRHADFFTLCPHYWF
jgi:hypothetical protein